MVFKNLYALALKVKTFFEIEEDFLVIALILQN
jgi:hypothetical protein